MLWLSPVVASWLEMSSWENTISLAKIRQIGKYLFQAFHPPPILTLDEVSEKSFCPLLSPQSGHCFSIHIDEKSSCQEQSDRSKWIINVFTLIVTAIAVVKSSQETAVAAQTNV